MNDNERNGWGEESPQNNEITEAEDIQNMISEVTQELYKVHKGAYSEKEAIKAAALALSVQLKLSSIITDEEAKAKAAKNNIKECEAEAYFEAKNKESDGKKPTDVSLTQSVAKNENVKDAKSKLINAEKELKQHDQISTIMKDAHVFFRNLGKKDWS